MNQIQPQTHHLLTWNDSLDLVVRRTRVPLHVDDDGKHWPWYFSFSIANSWNSEAKENSSHLIFEVSGPLVKDNESPVNVAIYATSISLLFSKDGDKCNVVALYNVACGPNWLQRWPTWWAKGSKSPTEVQRYKYSTEKWQRTSKTMPKGLE